MYQVDPGGHEVLELKKAASWAGRNVLEIGCGGGRLARRLAGLGSQVMGIDPDITLLRAALLEPTTPTVRYSAADGLSLPFPPAAFDSVIFGWSL